VADGVDYGPEETKFTGKIHRIFGGIKQVAEPLKAQFDPWLSDSKDPVGTIRHLVLQSANPE
jgi:hypothetical protein